MRRACASILAAGLSACVLASCDGVAHRARSLSTQQLSARLVERRFGSGIEAFVRLTIVGRPYYFAIDTGASQTVLEPQVVESLALRKNGAPREVAPLGCNVSVQPIALRRWRLGRVSLPASTVYASRVLVPKGFPAPFGGLLSPVLLSQFGSMTIDYTSHRLLLGAGAPIGGDTVAIRIYRLFGIESTVKTRFDGRVSRFLVDTGASFSAIDSLAATQLRLPVVGRAITADGAVCRKRVVPVEVRGWSVAGVNYQRAIIARITNVLPVTYRKAGITGVVGSPTLSRRGTLTIDYTHATMNVGGAIRPEHSHRLKPEG